MIQLIRKNYDWLGVLQDLGFTLDASAQVGFMAASKKPMQ